jgi:pyridoxal biosynthesis lyase PdxS
VFIRAPWIEDVGANVEVLAEHDGHPVLARVSGGLGDAMSGIAAASLDPSELLETRGW